MLTVTTTSTDDQYTTTAAVKEMLGTTLTSDDALIDAMISRASRWADSHVGYPIAAQKYRESLAGYGGRRMMLERRNVAGVFGFWDATDTGAATTMLSSQYGLDADAGFVERNAGFNWSAPTAPGAFSMDLAAHYFPGEEYPSWLIDYAAGFFYGGLSTGSDLWTTEKGTTSTGRTLPEDIEEAVRYRVASIYTGDGNVVERRVGDLQVKYATDGDGRNIDPAEELLAPYRSVV